jgi:hypothetical protein
MNQPLPRNFRTGFSNTLYSGSQIPMCACSLQYFVDNTVTYRLLGLKRGLAAARLLGLWVRIPPVAWMSVSCECWSLVQRSPTECGVSKSVIVKPRTTRRPRPPRGCRAIKRSYWLFKNVSFF